MSDSVLEAIAHALQFDDVERAHLLDLATAANTPPTRTHRHPTSQHVRPSVHRILDTMTGTAAFVRNGHVDILAANHLGKALYSPVLADPDRPPNLVRFAFLDRRAPEFYRDWNGIADAAVGSLRAEAGRDPDDRNRSHLTTELSLHSDEFRVRWAAHDVTYYRSGRQRSTTPSSATSPSTTTPSNFPPTPDRRSSPTPPRPAPRKDALNLLSTTIPE